MFDRSVSSTVTTATTPIRLVTKMTASPTVTNFNPNRRRIAAGNSRSVRSGILYLAPRAVDRRFQGLGAALNPVLQVVVRSWTLFTHRVRRFFIRCHIYTLSGIRINANRRCNDPTRTISAVIL